MTRYGRQFGNLNEDLLIKLIGDDVLVIPFSLDEPIYKRKSDKMYPPGHSTVSLSKTTMVKIWFPRLRSVTSELHNLEDLLVHFGDCSPETIKDDLTNCSGILKYTYQDGRYKLVSSSNSEPKFDDFNFPQNDTFYLKLVSQNVEFIVIAF